MRKFHLRVRRSFTPAIRPPSKPSLANLRPAHTRPARSQTSRRQGSNQTQARHRAEEAGVDRLCWPVPTTIRVLALRTSSPAASVAVERRFDRTRRNLQHHGVARRAASAATSASTPGWTYGPGGSSRAACFEIERENGLLMPIRWVRCVSPPAWVRPHQPGQRHLLDGRAQIKDEGANVAAAINQRESRGAEQLRSSWRRHLP